MYVAEDAIPGAIEKVRDLREQGIHVVFCTNNSRPTIDQYRAKLAAMGVEVPADDIVTSAVVTGEVLAEQRAGTTAMVIGGDGVVEAVLNAGLEIVHPPSPEVDLVVVGWDLDYTFEKMKRATLAVTGGALLIATNSDAAYPAPEGLWPGTGAIVASIERATGTTAEVMGKPHSPMMDAVARRLEGCRHIAIVGDRPDTDLAGGVARGWTTVLVLSGVTRSPEGVAPTPDVVLDSLADLRVEAGA